MSWSSRCTELQDLQPTRLGDADALGALLVAVAGAMGVAPLAPPVVRSGPGGWVAALLCADAHIVLHAVPDERRCLVDLVATSDTATERGLEVIARRLGATASP